MCGFMWDGVVKERENFADSASFKRLKNLILRRDGEKRKGRNCGVWRVCQSGRVRRGRKFEIQGRI